MLTEKKFNVKLTTHANYDFNIPATDGNASGSLIHLGTGWLAFPCLWGSQAEVKMSCLITHHAMSTHGASQLQLHEF